VATSIDNSKALAAWKRQPEINGLIADRDKLQKQFDKILATPGFSAQAEKEATSLYEQIAALNKKIGTKTSRANKVQD
jgi:hypothetical protein